VGRNGRECKGMGGNGKEWEEVVFILKSAKQLGKSGNEWEGVEAMDLTRKGTGP